jgi:hypothetical protein
MTRAHTGANWSLQSRKIDFMGHSMNGRLQGVDVAASAE